MARWQVLGRPWWVPLCAAIDIALLWVPSWINPLTSVSMATYMLALGTLIVAGWISLGRAAQRANGVLMTLLAFSFSTSQLQSVEQGPWALLATLEQPTSGILLGVLLLRWPRARLQTRWQRRLVAAAIVIGLLVTVVADITWDPHWVHFPGSWWWPTLVHDEALGNLMYDISNGAYVLLLVALVILMAARIVHASRPERRQLVPVVIAACAFVGLAVQGCVELITDASFDELNNVLSNISVMAVPLSFLIALAVHRVQRALAVEALLDPGRLASADAVERALSRALGDRRLTLATWSPQQAGYLVSDGTAAPDDEAGRHLVYVTSPADGAPLARIGISPRLAGQTELVEAVLRAAGASLDNARLQAELRAGQRQAELSAERLGQAEAARQRLTRLLPGGLAERLSQDPDAFTTAELLTVTILMSDIRGYTGLAEVTPPAQLAVQLNEHRQAMNEAVLAQGGTVMQYVGDAVMAVFGAPEPLDRHQQRALAAAAKMHAAQEALNVAWAGQGRPPFGLGIGLNTGQVAAALLGSHDRVEYTMVGDTVNLAYRLCDAARPAGSTVASAATVNGVEAADGYQLLPALRVKGRATTVAAYRWAGPG